MASKSDFKYIAFDIEADGFRPSVMWCIVLTDLITGETRSFTGDDIAEACIMLAEARMIVGHYIRGYDCPVIERLTDGMIKFDPARIVDTLEMSKRLTNYQKHGLKAWGPIVGLEKMEAPIFESFSPEMVTYCIRDVDVTVRVFNRLVELYLEGNRETRFRNCELLEEYFAAM